MDAWPHGETYRLKVAIDPVEPQDDFTVVVDRVRSEILAAGEDKAPAAGEYVSPFGREQRDAIMRLLRDGTYRRAAVGVGRDDPELSDQ